MENWILVGLLLIVGFFAIRHWKGLTDALGKVFKDGASAIAVVVVALIVAITIIAIIVIFKPQILAPFLSQAGPFGPGLQVSRAEAKLQVAMLDPKDDPRVWKNQTAQAAAEAVVSEYQLATARNKAGISAAEADRLSHLPKGHPDRALWDVAGMDPAVGSLPSVIQVAGQTVSKISIPKETEEKLSKPLGVPPFGAEKWVQTIYQLPMGGVVLAAIMLMMVVIGVSFKLVR